MSPILLLPASSPFIPTPVGSRATIHARRRVEVAFTNAPYDSNPTYTEISWALRDEQTPIKMRRGRQNELQQYDAGDFSCLLDNRTRNFEPQLSTGPYFPNIQPDKKVRYTIEYPWLPGLIPTYIFTQGVGEWVPSTSFTANCTIATQAGQGYMKDLLGSAYPSLRVTATGAGDAYIENPYYFPCTPGESLAASFRAKAVTTSRTLEMHFRFYNSNGGFLSESVTTFNIVGFTEVTGAYTRFGATATAPTNAAYVKMVYRILVCGAGEQHDFDAFVLQDRASFQGIYPRYVGFADSWLPQYPPSTQDAYINLSSHDGFKLLGGKDLTDVGYATALKALTPDHYFRLGDVLGSSTAADEMDVNNPGFAYSAVVFGVPGGLLADINTAALFDTGWIDLGTSCSWQGTGAQSVTFIYTWESPTFQSALMAQGPWGDKSRFQWTIEAASGSPTILQFRIADQNAFPLPTIDGFDFAAPNGDGKYHLVTLTRHADGITYEIFVDGVAVTPTNSQGGTISGTTYTATTNVNFDLSRLLLGTSYWEVAQGVGEAGILDEVAFWHGTAITLTQHQTLWNLMTAAWLSQTSGQRIGAVLDLIGWPAADRNLDAGNQTLPAQVDPLAGASLKTNTLDYLRLIEQSEGGQEFMSNKGEVRLIARQNQYKAPYTTVQAVFGDRPGTVDSATGLTELPYSSPKPDFGDSTLYTEAEVTRAIPGGGQGVTQWAHDATITNNPKKVATRTGLLLQDDLQAFNYANWLFRSFSIAKYMFRQIVLNPTDNDAVWYQLCVREVGDRIAVIKRPPGWSVGQPLIRVECLISAIEETGKRKESIHTWMLGQVSSVNYLVLDDPVYGKLDAGNYVAY